jgi:hypothetical protein
MPQKATSSIKRPHFYKLNMPKSDCEYKPSKKEKREANKELILKTEKYLNGYKRRLERMKLVKDRDEMKPLVYKFMNHDLSNL